MDLGRVQKWDDYGARLPGHVILAVVDLASFLRFLHCGRYPWLWNDEHVLVLLAVV